MIWKRFNRIMVLVPVGFFFLYTTAHALSALPIQIQSDQASFDHHTGVALHEGSVLLSQGDRQLFADKLVVQRDAHGNIVTVTALGEPARYTDFDLKNHNALSGQARKITYQPQKMLLTLEDQAELNHPPDLFQSALIEYDVAQQRITASSIDNNRSVLILQPR